MLFLIEDAGGISLTIIANAIIIAIKLGDPFENRELFET